MKKANWLLNGFIALALIGGSVRTANGQAPTTPSAEPSPQPHFYRLDFVVKELEGGKVINSRSYFMSLGTVPNPKNNEFRFNNYENRSIRTGTKVPVPAQLGDKVVVTDRNGISSAVDAQPGQITYVDVGISIDCRNLVALGSKIAMSLSADVSSVKDQVDDHSKAQTIATPLIQQNRWNSDVVVPLGTPTVVFSSDEVTSKRTLELEVTATEIK